MSSARKNDLGIDKVGGRSENRLPGGIGEHTMTRMAAVPAGIFVFLAVMAAASLPPSSGAPAVGQRAPEFSLPDSHGRVVSLSELRGAGSGSSWTLLVFYRGYW